MPGSARQPSPEAWQSTACRPESAPKALAREVPGCSQRVPLATAIAMALLAVVGGAWPLFFGNSYYVVGRHRFHDAARWLDAAGAEGRFDGQGWNFVRTAWQTARFIQSASWAFSVIALVVAGSSWRSMGRDSRGR